MRKLIVALALTLLYCPQNAQAWWNVKNSIYTAAQKGDTITIERILAEGYSIDEKDSDGNTALCTASLDYNPYAYDLLLSYGANPYAACMNGDEEKVTKAATDYDAYLIGGGIALAAGGIIALSSGGGGGGGGDTPVYDPVFVNDPEYKSSDFYTSTYTATNFLASINADVAYRRYYKMDELGNVTNTLPGSSTVGIIDTGVYGGHSEFSNGIGGSKVSGYNYDYGPCVGGNIRNCWKFNEDDNTLTLMDDVGQPTEYYGMTDAEHYNAWVDAYPENYDWNTYRERSDSYYPITKVEKNPLDDESRYDHGTHVAGIIAANHNGVGMMGVAFSNTDIEAVRWDFMSPLYNPIKTLVDDKVVAINMSLGTTANSSRSSQYYYNTDDMYDGWVDAAGYTISQYDTTGTYKDGTIWVKAAGNNGYDYPDIESGIKLVGAYSDLMMLVVVNVEVKLNDDGTVNTYNLVNSSNKCGNTSGYCIAAPGRRIASTDTDGEYIIMSGTSQAAPMVTGAIAFLKNAYPSMKSEQIISLLMNTANKNAESGYDEEVYGAGLLDLGAALQYQSPAGTSSIVTVSGNSLDSSSVRLDNASLNVSSSLASGLLKALPESVTVFDAYGRAYEYSTSNYVRSTHSGYKNFKSDVEHIIPSHKKHDVWQGDIHFKYAMGGSGSDGLNYMMTEYKQGRHKTGFYYSENSKYEHPEGKHSDMTNPYMSFNSAYGVTHSYELNNRLSLKMDISGGENGLYDGSRDYQDEKFKKLSYGFNSGLEYQYTKSLKLGISSGMLYEQGALLGTNGNNAFDLSGGETYHVGLTTTLQASKNIKLTGSYYQGYSKPQSTSSGMIRTTNLISSGFAADANYQYDEATSFGLRLSSPLKIEKGGVVVDMASGRDVESDQVYRKQYQASLKSNRREYKLSFYADKDVNEDISLSTELGVRFNPEHTDASNDYRALFGLSWNF